MNKIIIFSLRETIMLKVAAAIVITYLNIHKCVARESTENHLICAPLLTSPMSCKNHRHKLLDKAQPKRESHQHKLLRKKLCLKIKLSSSQGAKMENG